MMTISIKLMIGCSQMDKKVIVVEGNTDRDRILQLIIEPVEIIVTYGTLSQEKIEEWIIPLEHEEHVYILVDADYAGNKLRKQLKQILPNARHLYTRKIYKEIATTPEDYLLKMFADAHFEVKSTEI